MPGEVHMTLTRSAGRGARAGLLLAAAGLLLPTVAQSSSESTPGPPEDGQHLSHETGPGEQPPAGAAILPADTALEFADQLLDWGDPFNALTWYRYALFLAPQSDKADIIRFKIALSYELGERWDAAEVAYGRIQDTQLSAQAAYRAAATNLQAGRYQVADQAFQGVELYWPDSPWAELAAFARGVTFLQAGDLAMAARRFSDLGAGAGPWAGKAMDISRSCLEPLPRRSPAMASVLSSLVPGSGQIYSGHLGDGVMAFISNGVLGTWSYTLLRSGLEQDKAWEVGMGSTIGAMFLVTWMSNIHGAWRSAVRHNQRVTRQRAAALLSETYDPALQLEAAEVLPPGK